MQQLGAMIAESGLFGIKTIQQAVTLMAIAQAEGRPAALAARDYHVIAGRPVKKSEAMLRDFQSAGGSVRWLELSDTVARAVFSHPQGGEVTIEWTLDMAKKIMVEEWQDGPGGRVKRLTPLADRQTWKNYPRQLLRARCVSEGVRTVYPGATSGMLVEEEVRDMIDVTPEPEPVPAVTIPAGPTLAAVIAAYESAGHPMEVAEADALAKTLPPEDKPAAREAAKRARHRIRDAAAQTVEQAPQQAQEQPQGAPDNAGA
jgi:hypothetical protein